MSREQVVDKVVRCIYSTKLKCLYTQQEIDGLNEDYKEAHRLSKDKDWFLERHNNRTLLAKEKVIDAEISEAFDSGRALMSGALSECNLSATIARIFELNDRIIIKGASSCIPPELIAILNQSLLSPSKCRYIYRNSTNNKTCLFQFGAPDMCDAYLYIDGEMINIEYKERKAKAGEYDLDHDADGKLIIPESVQKDHPEVIRMVEQFNARTNLFDEIGHNYNDFDDVTGIYCISRYFSSKNIDIIVSLDVNNELIAVILDWVELNLDKQDGGLIVLSAEGSEIRTTGRNSYSIVCPKHFQKIFHNNGGSIDSSGKCEISSGSSILRVAKGRGTGRPSKLKIASIYEVPLKNKGYGIAQEHGGKWHFNISSVRQKKPTVSPHISIVATKQQIRKHFGL